MKRDRILGIPYDNVFTEEALLKAENFLHDYKSHTIVHMSLPLLMMARRSKMLRMFLEEADLIIPSGKYLFWAANLMKRPFKEVIDPSLFVKMLMVQSVEIGKNVYLFGGKGQTIDRAFINLKKEIPKLFVIGRKRGNYRNHNHENVVIAIGKASPDYFFIGLGSPHEEIWVNRNRRKINAKLIILIEGLFDVYAGNVKKRLSYKKNWNIDKISKREILYSHSLQKALKVPVFILLVLIEKIFWRN